MYNMVSSSMSKKAKKPGPEPRADAKKVLFALRLSEQEMESIRVGAKKKGVSMAEFIMAPHRETKEKE